MSKLKKLRAALGLGSVGGALGGVFGVAWWAGTELLDPALGFGSLGFTASLWAGFGALSAAGAGLLLGRLGRATSLGELSTARVAILGTIVGATAPLASLLLVGFPAANAPLLALITGLFGGAVAGGLTQMAKAAPDDAAIEDGADPSEALLRDGRADLVT